MSFIVSPAICKVPEVIDSSPAMQRSSVDLPHPDGPTSAVNAPLGIVKLMSLSAWKSP